MGGREDSALPDPAEVAAAIPAEGDEGAREEAPAGEVREEPQGEVVEEPAEPAEPGQTVTVRYKGREVTIPMEKAIELTSKGYDYEVKMAELKQERESIASDAEGLAHFKEYQRFLENNPDVAHRLQEVVQHYAQTGQLPALDTENAEEVQTVDPKVRELEMRLARIEGQGQVDALASQLNEAIDARPLLANASKRSMEASGGQRDLVLEKLVQAHRADPTASVDALADSLATELGLVVDPLSNVVQRKNQDAEDFRGVSPSGSGASAAPMPRQTQHEFGGDDMKSGRVADAVKRFLSEDLGPGE